MGMNWEAELPPEPWFESHVWTKGGREEGSHIATVHKDTHANLIAAAPDLLAACKKLREAWKKTDIKADFADQMVIGERFAEIDAAIAKAEGG